MQILFLGRDRELRFTLCESLTATCHAYGVDDVQSINLHLARRISQSGTRIQSLASCISYPASSNQHQATSIPHLISRISPHPSTNPKIHHPSFTPPSPAAVAILPHVGNANLDRRRVLGCDHPRELLAVWIQRVCPLWLLLVC